MYINSIISISAIAVMVATIILEVVARYIFNYGVPWAEEITNYMLVALAMFGAGLNMQEEKDISLELVVQTIKNHVFSAGIRIVSFALIIVFSSMLLIHGVVFSIQGFTRFSITLNIPMFFPYLFIPLGALNITIVAVFKIITSLQKRNADAAETGDP